MDKLIERKVDAFKKKWLQLKGQESTDKIIWYFKKGIEKQQQLIAEGQPIIVAERCFDSADVLLTDDEHYPSRGEYEDCKQAFSLGFFTNLQVYYI